MQSYLNPNGKLELTNVHDAMMDAVHERECEKMKTTTIRMPQNLLDKTDFILHMHGVNFSEWIRACCKGLIRDYEEISKR